MGIIRNLLLTGMIGLTLGCGDYSTESFKGNIDGKRVEYSRDSVGNQVMVIQDYPQQGIDTEVRTREKGLRDEIRITHTLGTKVRDDAIRLYEENLRKIREIPAEEE